MAEEKKKLLKISVSDEVFELLIHEFADRVKDLCYMKAEDSVRTALELSSHREKGYRTFYMYPDGRIDIHIIYSFNTNDLLQLIGRVRRLSEGKD
jgi:hypothetical protein